MRLGPEVLRKPIGYTGSRLHFHSLVKYTFMSRCLSFIPSRRSRLGPGSPEALQATSSAPPPLNLVRRDLSANFPKENLRVRVLNLKFEVPKQEASAIELRQQINKLMDDVDYKSLE